ncbi:MAG: ribosome biogenesis GTPase Der [Rickettsiaceae bacterium]|nr:ribosome biogenesis GTPase Der [Rickettsiaceae bacterium]
MTKKLVSKKLIALVGRPNVGKSTLFNRLSVRSKAIVHNKPGVTRDRKYADGAIGSMEFTIVDTPGLEEAAAGALEDRMIKQTIAAIKEADLVCLIVDNLDGITPIDQFFAKVIRKYNDNYIIIANKSEKTFYHDKAYYKLGFGTPVTVSAEHGQGLVDLYEAIADKIDVEAGAEIDDPVTSDKLQIVIVGRPNAGKSTFINSLLGSQRMLTGSEAGITRESVETKWQYKDYDFSLIDTAGLRRRANVTESLEKMSTGDTISSIKFANVVILMLDALIALENQDLTIANYVIEQGRALVIVVNKWDLVEDKKAYKEEFYYQLEKLLPQIRGIPVVFISAINNKSDKHLNVVLDRCIDIYKLWNVKIPTAKLNDWLQFVLENHPLPMNRKLGRRVRVKYTTQINTRPPTFKFFTSSPASITDSYKKYLTNSLREDFNLPGVPIRLFFTKSANPYSSRNR